MKFSLLAVLLAKISMLTQVQPYPTEITSTELNKLYSQNNELDFPVNQLLADIPDFSESYRVLFREKREPKGGYARGGGGRSSMGRSRSSHRSSSRGRGSYRVSKNFYNSKKWYNLNGKTINLYKSFLYTKSGKIKQFITTTKGIKYKINRVNNWLNIKTKDNFAISTLPKIVQYKHNNHLFKLAVCNFYFNYQWSNPLEMHLLYHKNNLPFKLLFITNHEDETIIDIGYYDINEPTSNLANSTVESNHTMTEVKKVKTFIKLASINRGSNVSFGILNQESANKPITTTSSPQSNNTDIVNNNTTIDYNITTLPYNITEKNTTESFSFPIIINPNNTDIDINNTNTNYTQNITPLPNSTISYDANNITEINSVLNEQDILNTHAQLVIITDNNIVQKISLPHKVDSFLINSNNDTILTYSMNGPKIEKKLNKNIKRWWRWSAATTGKDINISVISALVLLAMKSLL